MIFENVASTLIRSNMLFGTNYTLMEDMTVTNTEEPSLDEQVMANDVLNDIQDKVIKYFRDNFSIELNTSLSYVVLALDMYEVFINIDTKNHEFLDDVLEFEGDKLEFIMELFDILSDVDVESLSYFIDFMDDTSIRRVKEYIRKEMEVVYA